MILLGNLRGCVRVAVVCLLAMGLATMAGSVRAQTPDPAAVRQGYDYYQVGDLNLPRPGATAPGLMLVGGGHWPLQAFAWLADQGGHGHFVILRASGAHDLQDKLYTEVGGVASVQTLVFHSREAASDPAVLEIVRRADGIFIAGGDQSNYVRFWKGTPLNEALNQHVEHRKPIGGTSAGLAMLGGYVYGALDGGSLLSEAALHDPLGKGVTLLGDFMHLPNLQQVITDSHFHARDRLGRLIAFVARLRHEGHAGVVGLGVDEGTALCVDDQGIGRLYTRDNGLAWLVRPRGNPARIEVGQSLDYRNIRVTGIGPLSRIDMRDLSVQRPVFDTVADVHDGQLQLRDPGVERAMPAPIEAGVR